MFTSFEFRKDFEKARDELRKALNLPLMRDFTR